MFVEAKGFVRIIREEELLAKLTWCIMYRSLDVCGAGDNCCGREETIIKTLKRQIKE